MRKRKTMKYASLFLLIHVLPVAEQGRGGGEAERGGGKARRRRWRREANEETPLGVEAEALGAARGGFDEDGEDEAAPTPKRFYLGACVWIPCPGQQPNATSAGF